jgi:YfiH family protein
LSERSPVLEVLGIEHGFAVRRGGPTDAWRVQQVHGAELVRAPGLAPGTRADAIFTSEPGCALAIQTADCVPLLLVHRARRAVAAVHAGWRGSAAQIARSSVARLCDALGTPPADWLAVIGPHIGPCCYEVDEPVRSAFHEPLAFAPAGRPGHYMLDLERVTRAQLAAAGIAAADVTRVGGCTHCDPRRYPSFRRDGTGARMFHWLRAPGIAGPGSSPP